MPEFPGRAGWIRVATPLIVAGCLLLGEARTRAEQNAGPSFSQILEAGYHTGYEALQQTTITSDRGRSSHFTAIILQAPDGRRSVRVTAPPRRVGEIEVDDGRYRWRFNPHRNGVMIAPSTAARHAGQHTRGAEALLTYAGADTVAGRPTTIYDVTPLKPGSPATRIWVDDSTLVTLRTDWTNQKGNRISQAYSRIAYGPRSGIAFHWPAGAGVLVKDWPAAPGSPLVRVDIPLALPTSVPAGLIFDGVWLRELAGRQTLWLHFHERKRGHRDLSLFETLQTPRSVPFSGVENWNLGPLNITMVGNVLPSVATAIRRTTRIVSR